MFYEDRAQKRGDFLRRLDKTFTHMLIQHASQVWDKEGFRLG